MIARLIGRTFHKQFFTNRNIIAFQFCNKKPSGFERFNKKKVQSKPKAQSRKEQMSQQTQKLQKQTKQHKTQAQSHFSSKESKPNKQTIAGTGFNRFQKNKKVDPIKKDTKQSIFQMDNKNIKNEDQPTKSSKQEKINHIQEKQNKQQQLYRGFTKFSKQQNARTKKAINEQNTEKDEKKASDIKERQQLQKQYMKQQQQLEKERQEREQKIQQGEKYFKQQMKRAKERSHQQKQGPVFNFFKQFKKKPQKQPYIPDFIKKDQRLLKWYSLAMQMKSLIAIGVAALIFFLFYQSKKGRAEDVQPQFILKYLKQDQIASTWMEKEILDTYEHMPGKKHAQYIYIKNKSQETFRAQSNQEFNKYWAKQVMLHNSEASITGLKQVILQLPTIESKNTHLADETRGILGAILLFMFLRLILKRGGQPNKKDMKGNKNFDQFSMFPGKSKSRKFKQPINVKFNDVVGMQKAKQQIVQFIDFLKNSQKYEKLGAKIPRGALLTGPPGTGKTMIAKACAGQSKVPFFTISGSQFIEMYVGVGAQRVRQIFAEAKQEAPSIIFIDEIDAVGKKRAPGVGGGNDQRDSTLNQLLVQMDGFNTKTNVIVFAATNQKEVLDSALTRPGRFDRIIQVDLPDLQGRRQIFMVHLKPIVLAENYKMEQYAKRMATLTPGFSGADIKNLCNQAAILAARGNKQRVTMIDFELATQRIIGGVQRKSILISPQTRKTVAYHQCGHGVVSWFLEGANPLLKLTIIPRSKGALGFAQYLPNETKISSKKQLEDQICVILGGRISQEIFFGKISTGAYDDLQKAYQVAKMIITQHGMSQDLGWLSFSETQYAKQYSHSTQAKIDDEILKIVKKCSTRTRALILEKKTLIDQLATKLLQLETIDQNIIEETLGARPFKASKQYEDYITEKRKLALQQSPVSQTTNNFTKINEF